MKIQQVLVWNILCLKDSSCSLAAFLSPSSVWPNQTGNATNTVLLRRPSQAWPKQGDKGGCSRSDIFKPLEVSLAPCQNTKEIVRCCKHTGLKMNPGVHPEWHGTKKKKKILSFVNIPTPGSMIWSKSVYGCRDCISIMVITLRGQRCYTLTTDSSVSLASTAKHLLVSCTAWVAQDVLNCSGSSGNGSRCPPEIYTLRLSCTNRD